MKERYRKIVFEAAEGVEYNLYEGKNGELIVRTILKEKESKQEADSFFYKITFSEREMVSKWINQKVGKTEGEKRFLSMVEEALEKVNYDYEISTIEPAGSNGKIAFAINEKVAIGYNANQWMQMCKNYDPERGSRIANLYELFIWYALRIAKGYWDLEYVANNSSSEGNYRNAPKTSHCMERTGTRKCGGFKDGQGNTYKIVKYKDTYICVGGYYFDYGNDFPVANIRNIKRSNYIHYNGCGVLVLTK